MRFSAYHHDMRCNFSYITKKPKIHQKYFVKMQNMKIEIMMKKFVKLSTVIWRKKFQNIFWQKKNCENALVLYCYAVVNVVLTIIMSKNIWLKKSWKTEKKVLKRFDEKKDPDGFFVLLMNFAFVFQFAETFTVNFTTSWSCLRSAVLQPLPSTSFLVIM